MGLSVEPWGWHCEASRWQKWLNRSWATYLQLVWMLLWLKNPLKLVIGLPFLKVSSLVKLYPLPKPWTVNPYLRSATSWMMSSLFWESVDRSWGVSFLLWWNRVVSSLSLLGSFIGRFGLHGCSILLWTFPSTSSYALKQSRSNPSLLHLIRGTLYIPLF